MFLKVYLAVFLCAAKAAIPAFDPTPASATAFASYAFTNLAPGPAGPSPRASSSVVHRRRSSAGEVGTVAPQPERHTS